MRGAFGTPGAVIFARQTGPDQLLAVLDFDGVPCLFDMALAAYDWWDEWLHVHGEREEVRIAFQNPYIRHATATVTVRAPGAGETSEQVIRGAPDTAFRRELMHFADCIAGGTRPRTPLRGGLADLDLAVAIIKAMPPRRAPDA
jgi:predicted dehydrogenase